MKGAYGIVCSIVGLYENNKPADLGYLYRPSGGRPSGGFPFACATNTRRLYIHNAESSAIDSTGLELSTHGAHCDVTAQRYVAALKECSGDRP